MRSQLQPFARTGDGVVAVDSRYRVVFWNASAEQMLGIPAEEAVGQLCYQLLNGRTADNRPVCSCACPIMAMVERGQPVSAFDLQLLNGWKNRTCVNLSIVPYGSDGHPGSSDFLLVHLFRAVSQPEPWSWEGGMADGLRIHLLGAIQAVRPDGTVVDGRYWRRLKVRALLALLAVNRGQKLHRDQILEALWPTMNYETALHNFNTTVYYLRRCLEPELTRGAASGFIHYEADSYVLSDYERHWLDSVAFEETVLLARKAQSPAEALEYYRDALRLYKGQFLADLIYEDLAWCAAERDRLHEVYLNTLENLADALESCGQDEEAAETYLRVISIDPCRESTTQRLMLHYLKHGNRAAALERFVHLTQALDQDLGVAPSAGTHQLYKHASGADLW